MKTNQSKPHDKYYKFLFHRMGIKAHNFFKQENNEDEEENNEISFIETEIPDTEQKGDINYQNVNTIHQVEVQATPLNIPKLKDMFDYHEFLRLHKTFKGKTVKSKVISLANPKHGTNSGLVYHNIHFEPEIIFTKKIDGEKILSTLTDKCKTQEPLTDNDQMGLLILPDTDINIPIHDLLELTSEIIIKANISKKDRDDLILCQIMCLNRFFNNDKITEMIDMLITKTSDPKVNQILEEFGPGFDAIYLDGKAEGIAEGIAEGRAEGIAEGSDERAIEIAKNLISMGYDDEDISHATGLSVAKIQELKREL